MKYGKWLLVASLCTSLWTYAADEQFDIVRFKVEGNTLLADEEVQRLVSPFAGTKRVYGDIQRALEALEGRYRAAGFGTVQVFVPEQELTGGVVKIHVLETQIGKVMLSGNRHFSDANIRRTLPHLKEGTSPNLRQISENVQLANENPAKQVDVTLAVSDEEGKVDAKVQVEDEAPRKYIFSLDNTGDKNTTGQYRLSAAYRNANLFGGDEVMTLGYVTSPDAPGSVKLDVYSIGFRMPLYALGDSLDVIWGSSSVNIPSTVFAIAMPFNMTGKGDVLALRWNHLLPREGEFTSRVVFGFDQKNTQNPCKLAGTGALFLAPSCVSTTELLASVTYSGQWQKPRIVADYSIGVTRNTGLGGRQDDWRYNLAAQGRTADPQFTILQAGGSYSYALDNGMTARAAVVSQFSATPLPAGDQINLAGSTAVRGFNERAVTADSGFVLNAELYTPDLSPFVKLFEGGILKGLVFFDMASGRNRITDGYRDQTGAYLSTVGAATLNQNISIASAGFGFRYAIGKDTSARFDWANILNSNRVSQRAGYVDSDWRAHFGISHSF